MKLLGLFGFMILTVLFLISDGKYFPGDDSDDEMELSGVNARSFLKSKPHYNLNKPTNDLDCVLCKFNIVPCCKPNICIKKRLRPDECLELKGRDID
ncbi:hypothetical protein I4U23_019261 [Adineta vaga]|nr:hypothetical protein I4U23_019261 [Adineta vaga]